MNINSFYIKIALSVIFISILWSCNFAPGSYPYAEEYEVESNEDSLIEAVKEFKTDNPEFQVPKDLQLIDGRSDENDLWYHLYFYYPIEKQIVYAWIREAGPQKATVALISINTGLTLGKWKRINKDYDSKKNKSEKEKFEARILKQIKERLK